MKIIIEKQINRGQNYSLYDIEVENPSKGKTLVASGACGIRAEMVPKLIKRILKTESLCERV